MGRYPLKPRSQRSEKNAVFPSRIVRLFQVKRKEKPQHVASAQRHLEYMFRNEQAVLPKTALNLRKETLRFQVTQSASGDQPFHRFAHTPG